MNNVVIVDDNNSQLMLLELLLNQIGINPATFLDPMQALEYIKSHKVDLLISDFKMPGMNGIELIRVVKEFNPLIRTAIVSSMLDTDGELRQECDNVNAPLLLKPFDALAFQEFMKGLLKKEFYEIYCIRNAESPCILRDKVATRYCMTCCKDDEREIVQSVIDAIDDFYPSELMLVHVNNKLSYMANTVSTGNNYDLKELFIIIKQLAVILHEYKEQILKSRDIMFLVTSYLNVIGEWLEKTFISEGSSLQTNNYNESIKADFQSIEMALGITTMSEDEYADLDDLFF